MTPSNVSELASGTPTGSQKPPIMQLPLDAISGYPGMNGTSDPMSSRGRRRCPDDVNVRLPRRRTSCASRPVRCVARGRLGWARASLSPLLSRAINVDIVLQFLHAGIAAHGGCGRKTAILLC